MDDFKNTGVFYTPQGFDPNEVNKKSPVKAIIKIMVAIAIFIAVIAVIVGLVISGRISNDGLIISPAKSIFYDESNKYSVGSASVTPVPKLEIEWVSGEVDIVYYDGDEIQFVENEQENDDYKLRYRTTKNTLYIEPCRNGITNAELKKFDKDLTVFVPENYAFKSIDIETVSGVINVTDITSDFIDIEYVSADINVSGSFKDLDFEGVSGALDVTNRSSIISKCDISTVSGDCILRLNKDISGFNCNYDSVSGGVSSKDFDGFESVKTLNSTHHKYGDGLIKIDYESVSGDLEITNN